MPPGNFPGPAGSSGKDVNINDGTLARAKSPLPGPLGLSAKSGGGKPSANTLRAQVLAYAQQLVGGDPIGRGECFDLADMALRNAGAKSAADFGQVTPDGNYRWGTQINLSELHPGDVIQFRNYSFVRRTTEADESWAEEVQERPHHTAIVEQVGSDGAVTVLEQNVPEGDGVRRCQLFFSNSDTHSEGRHIEVTVHGHFWFYRPEPR